MKHASFLLGRLIKGALVILGVVIINFFLIRLAPGDPAEILAGQAGASDPQHLAQLRTQFGLDQPVVTQLWLYLKGVAHLDLGYSYRNHVPVLDLILERLPATLLLMGCAFLFSSVLGVILGAIAARARYERRNGWLDKVITGTSVLLYATPLFWLSLMAILLFSVTLGWFPAFGIESPSSNYTGFARMGDIAMHLVLPTVTLGSFFMAVYVRLMRTSVLEVIGTDYIKTARAKGCSPNRVMTRHVLRNALMPVITFAGIQLGQMAGGAVLTETVFAWPGIGRLMFDSLLQRDYQLLLGIFVTTSFMVVVFNILTDVIYQLVDPRVKTAGAGQEAA